MITYINLPEAMVFFPGGHTMHFWGQRIKITYKYEDWRYDTLKYEEVKTQEYQTNYYDWGWGNFQHVIQFQLFWSMFEQTLHRYIARGFGNTENFSVRTLRTVLRTRIEDFVLRVWGFQILTVRIVRTHLGGKTPIFHPDLGLGL